MTDRPQGVGEAPCLRLDALHRRLALLAQAMGERPLRLRADGAPVTFARLAPRAAEPDVLRLPAAVPGFGTDRERAGAYRIAVLREVLRLEGSAPTPDTLASGAADPIGPPAARPRLHRRLVAMLERLRLDAAIRKRFPGARADLDRVLRQARARCAAGPAATRAGSTRRLLACLSRGLLDEDRASVLADARDACDASDAPDDLAARLAGSDARDAPDALAARLAGMLDAADAVRAPGASARDSAAAADRICALLAAAARDDRARDRGGPMLRIVGAAPSPLDPDRPGAPDPGSRGSAGDGQVDALARGEARPPPAAPRVDHAGTRSSATTGAAAAPARTSAPAGPSGAGASSSDAQAGLEGADGPSPDEPRPPASTPRRPATAGPHSVLHDEWDCLRGRYLRAWCRVNEHRLRGDAVDFIGDVRRRHPELARRIRGRFAAARPLERRRMPRVADGDEIDLDALVEGIVERRAGRDADPRPHLRRDPQERTVAAAFLVDMSASTSLALPEPADEGSTPADAPPPKPWVDQGALLYGLYDDDPRETTPRAPRRRVIDVAKDALALMSDALGALGDAHAIWGFSGNGRHDVEFHVAKDFGDPVSPASWAAIGAIEPRGSTRMGAAIRHAAMRLARQTARQRLLIVVSDGYPQDTDYGPVRGDDSYGIHDTARALLEAARAGLSTFCITIDPGGHDYLRRMCAERHYLVIDDVQALPAALAKVYLGLTDRR